MIETLKELYSILTDAQKKSLFKLQFFVVFMAFSEVIGIAAIGPFLALAGDFSVLEEEGMLRDLFIWTGTKDPANFIFLIGACVLIIISISTLISTFAVRALLHFAQRLGAEISSSLYDFYMQQPWLFHSHSNSSRLMNNVTTECNRVTAGIIYPIMVMNAKIAVGTAIVILLILIDPFITFFGFLIFGLIYILIFSIVKIRLSTNGKIITKTMQIRFKLMNEGFDGIKDTLVLGRSGIFRTRFSKESTALGRALGSNVTMNEVPKYWVELIAFGAMISLILYLLAFNGGSLTSILPKLGIFAMASYKLLPAFQQVYGNLTYIKGSASALDSIKQDLIDWKDLPNQDSILNDKKELSFNKLSLKNISFQYPGKNEPALENISIDIDKNKAYGFVGKSGAGKSTLVDIILGLIAPKSGTIYLDDKNFEIYGSRLWQKSIGYVPQSIFLADATVEENIAFGIPKKDINPDKIQHSVLLSNLKDLIEEMPMGLKTMVGEKGLQLSGGQRQRIAIARALYHDPEILIFDEATSALDGLNEKIIMDSIYALSQKKTIILIAHRLNTVKRCEHIFLFDKGKIVDSGGFQQMVEQNKQFKDMTDHS